MRGFRYPPPPHEISERALQYFFEIAYGSESGKPYPGLRTWDRQIRVRIRGTEIPGDIAEVDRVLADINRLAPRTVIIRSAIDPNLDVFFTDQEGFDSYAPTAARRANGYVHVWWNGSDRIHSGRVLIRRVTPC